MHVDVTTTKLKKKFGVDVDLTTPRIPYRETIKGSSRLKASTKSRPVAAGNLGTSGLNLSIFQRRILSLSTRFLAAQSPGSTFRL